MAFGALNIASLLRNSSSCGPASRMGDLRPHLLGTASQSGGCLHAITLPLTFQDVTCAPYSYTSAVLPCRTRRDQCRKLQGSHAVRG